MIGRGGSGAGIPTHPPSSEIFMDLSETLASLEARIAALEEVVSRSIPEKKSSWTAPWFDMAKKKCKPKKPSK